MIHNNFTFLGVIYCIIHTQTICGQTAQNTARVDFLINKIEIPLIIFLFFFFQCEICTWIAIITYVSHLEFTNLQFNTDMRDLFSLVYRIIVYNLVNIGLVKFPVGDGMLFKLVLMEIMLLWNFHALFMNGKFKHNRKN